MTNNDKQPPKVESTGYHSTLDLVDLIAAVWKRKLTVFAITVAAGVLSVLVALWLPNIYRAEVLLAPKQSQGAGSVTNMIPQISGLASIAGLSLDDGVVDRTTLGLAILESRAFLGRFVEQHDLLVPLMAADGWDPNSEALLIDDDIYDTSKEEWVRNVDPPLAAKPSLQEVYERFQEILSVFRSEKSGLVTVSIDHVSPVFAKEVLDKLIADLNRTMIQQAVTDANSAIQYLSEQISRTSLSEMQSVFYQLIEEQTKIKMLAITQPDYVFRVVDPAVVPDLKAGPNRKLIVIVMTMFSFVFAVLFVLIFSFHARRSDSSV